MLLLAAVIALGAECLRQTGRWSFELDVLSGLTLAPAHAVVGVRRDHVGAR